LISTKAQFSPFPTEGNTFYADLIRDGTNGQFYANMQVGSQKQYIKSIFSTNQLYSAIVSTQCNSICQVQNKWDPSLSKTANLIDTSGSI
jgi:hypothetical protein